MTAAAIYRMLAEEARIEAERYRDEGEPKAERAERFKSRAFTSAADVLEPSEELVEYVRIEVRVLAAIMRGFPRDKAVGIVKFRDDVADGKAESQIRGAKREYANEREGDRQEARLHIAALAARLKP
jgi:hypothetical protein